MAPLDPHRPTRWWRRTIFWKLAALLVGVQVLIGVVAVGLSAYFAYAEGLDLVENSLRLRLDALAEEMERRVPDFAIESRALPAPVVNDLATRFPDPVVLVDAEGRVLQIVRPDPRVFGGTARADDVQLPSSLAADLASGDIVIHLESSNGTRAYAVAPLYDAVGFVVGGVVVIPLDRSIRRELEETAGALRRAATVVALLAVLVAVLLGGLLTWRIMRPIRLVTSSVEQIGGGDYHARLTAGRDDEFGRLAASINVMAGQVEESFSRLVATDRLRRDLVANIGHDLRTPLGALLGHVEEARRTLEVGDADSSRTSLESARAQISYVTRLVEDLFELSLLDSDAPPLRLEPVPLGELIRQAGEGHRGLLKEDGKQLELSIQPGLPVIEADGTRLLRLVQNLLDNARKHTPTGGYVSLSARADAQYAEVRVADDGPGIRPEELDSLFERYYRGASPRTRRGDGTGLGLAICRAIADAHGGSLTVASETGTGTTFTFRLPVRARPSGPASSAADG